MAIYNLLKQSSNHKIGIVDGVAHSVAFLILQSCDVRKMCLGTTALVHEMWMHCAGNAMQLRKYADDLDDMMESNRKVFLERATITEDELIEIMKNETYLTPDKALEYGLIDEIMGEKKAEQKADELLQKLQEMQKQLNEQQSFRQQLATLQSLTQKEPEPKKPEENTLLIFLKEIGGMN